MSGLPVKPNYYYVHEWTPKLQQTAEKLISDIHTVAPELKVLFMGAAALRLPGKNDVDLDILCDRRDLQHYIDILIPILGIPQETKNAMAVWSYAQDGIEIDCILSDPTTPDSHIPAQKKVFETLKASAELQERYKQLKYACNGLPYEQYEARKKEFLKEVEDL